MDKEQRAESPPPNGNGSKRPGASEQFGGTALSGSEKRLRDKACPSRKQSADILGGFCHVHGTRSSSSSSFEQGVEMPAPPRTKPPCETCHLRSNEHVAAALTWEAHALVTSRLLASRPGVGCRNDVSVVQTCCPSTSTILLQIYMERNTSVRSLAMVSR